MTETDAQMILAIMRQNYKNAKIEDPAAEVALWMQEFGDYPAEVIKTAVEFYMNDSAKRSDFWPTTAAIRKKIPRAENYISFVEANRPRPELIDPAREKKEHEELQTLINDIIDREREMYPDEDEKLLNDFLPYER